MQTTKIQEYSSLLSNQHGEFTTVVVLDLFIPQPASIVEAKAASASCSTACNRLFINRLPLLLGNIQHGMIGISAMLLHCNLTLQCIVY